jgi:hypothetical protein
MVVELKGAVVIEELIGRDDEIVEDEVRAVVPFENDDVVVLLIPWGMTDVITPTE